MKFMTGYTVKPYQIWILEHDTEEHMNMCPLVVNLNFRTEALFLEEGDDIA